MKHFILLLLFLPAFTQAQFTEQWNSTYDGDGDFSDHYSCITEDGNGNIYVAGYSHSTDENADFLVAKYNSAGQMQWHRTWRGNGQGPDIAYAIAFANNTVYAAGEVSNAGFGFDFFTIAISTSGDSLWGAHYNDAQFNQYDQANAICIDNSGNVIVTGESDRDPSSVINDDFLTIKYSPSGSLLWSQRYNNAANNTDRAVAVVSDASGNITVAGRSSNGGDDDYAVIQYSPSGSVNWTQLFDNGGLDRIADMGIDNQGNIYVTGRSDNGNDDDFRTLKYSSAGAQLFNVAYDFVEDDRADFMDVNPDGSFVVGGRSDGSAAALINYNYRIVKYSAAGAQQWTATYDGTAANDDILQDIDLNSSGEVLVTGYSDAVATPAIQNNLVSIRYNNSGTAMWTKVYTGNSTFDDEGSACLIDNTGKAWVAGHTENAEAQRDAILISYDSAGTEVSNQTWSGTGDNSDNAREFAIDNSGNIFVCGYSVGKDTDRDMFLMKLNSSGGPLWNRSLSGTLFGSDEEANAIAIDNAGNVIISGYTKNSGTGSDITILKCTNDGVQTWMVQYNNSANESDRSYDLATDATGNIYITGKTDINSSPIVTNDEIFTAKYSSGGTLLWSVIRTGGSGIDRGRNIHVASSGNVYVCGQSFNGTNDDYIVIKYSSSGNQVWSYTFDSGSFDLFKSSVIDANENIILTGNTSSTADYATSNITTVQVNSSGSLVWNQPITGTSGLSATVEEIALTPSGDIALVGSVATQAAPNYAYNGLAVKYSSAGALLWSNEYNATNPLDDIGDAITSDSFGNIIIACHSNTGSAQDLAYSLNLVGIDGATGATTITTSLALSDSLNICNDLHVANNELVAAGSIWNANTQRDIVVAKYAFSVGMSESQTPLLSMFPNPATSSINLNLPQYVSNIQAYIIDSKGSIVQSHTLQGKLIQLHVENLPSGNYILSIPAQKLTQTFIKK